MLLRDDDSHSSVQPLSTCQLYFNHSITQRKDPQDGLMQSYPIYFSNLAELEGGYVKVPPRMKGQLKYPN